MESLRGYDRWKTSAPDPVDWVECVKCGEVVDVSDAEPIVVDPQKDAVAVCIWCYEE